MSPLKPLISSLAAGEQRAMKDLSFTVKCKNSGKVHTYDFGGRQQYEKFRSITEIFVWALYKRRHRTGHATICSLRINYWKFLGFLDDVGVLTPSQLSRETLSGFSEWLKNQASLSYSSAGGMYRALAPTFLQMSRHEIVSNDFKPLQNAFPKSTTLQTPNAGYDHSELKSIVRAAVVDMREAIKKYTNVYVPRWLGRPAPMDDVAPRTANGGHTLWASMEYKVWWWENNCDCKRLNSVQLSKIPKGQGFMSSFAVPGKERMIGVQDFYDVVGAGDDYIPRYVGKENPIKYLTPWKKMDYLVWYWENKVKCAVLSNDGLREAAPELFAAIREHFDGKVGWFYERLGIHRWISANDLIPFYLMLLVRTQLNPSVVQRLTVDCLVPDPVDKNRKLLNYRKHRSSKEGQTIPSSQSIEGWPVMLINEVLNITCFVRMPGQKELWIANKNRYKEPLPLGSSGMKMALRMFSQRHKLVHTSGMPLHIQAQLIRPTMAWQEYLRTEDMNYLQSLLGHERLSTTADYLRRINDPVLLMRRAVHQEAMFLGLTGSKWCEVKGEKIKPVEGLLNHCKDPLHSPTAGQRDGEFCSAGHEVCLGCPNLIITLEDIKKHFCFISYHEQLFEKAFITEEEFKRATEEKKFMWEHYILPRYSSSLIKSIRADAHLNPVSIWSVSGEGDD